MAQDFTKDQLNVVSRLQTAIGTLLDTMNTLRLLSQEAGDKGYKGGGANAITDNLLNGGTTPPFPSLLASDVFNAFFAVGDIDSALAATSNAPTGTTRVDYTRLEKLRP